MPDRRSATKNLVFDLGFHRGEDSGYYLAMGRQVVAVEANAHLIEAGRQRFAEAVAEGRLTFVHAAIVGSLQRQQQPELRFYPHPQRSEWGSVDLRWVRRNAQTHGLPHGEPVVVSTISLPELVDQFGCPDYLKIDIEGADAAVLADLTQLDALPTTVSWETGKESLRAVWQQHRLLARLGYRRFRAVQQAYLHRKPPAPTPDGSRWTFEPGCSGCLPELCEQPWRPLAAVQVQYVWLFCCYRLVGPGSWFRRLAAHPNRWIAAVPVALQRWAERQHIALPGWFDSHASQ